jgi:UDP-glucose 4-epimerase
MSDWIFVTGGCGYIGSHIAAQLKSNTSHSVMIIDKKGKTFPHLTKYCDIFADEDVTSNVTMQAITDYKPSTIIHCAEDLGPTKSLLNPISIWEENVTKSVELLKSAASAGVKKFIFFSTGEVYADSDSPKDEHHPLMPMKSGSRSKISIEYLLRDCYVAHGISSISFRTFNVCGSHNIYDLGHLCGAPYLIPRIMESAVLGEKLEIFGNDFNTADGTAIRDYLHVMDLSDAVERSISWLDSHPGAYAMNLGSGTGTSVQEMVNLSESLLGKNLPYFYGNWRVGDPPIRIANISTIKDNLGWKPRRSNNEIILDSYKWYKSRTYQEIRDAGFRYE